MMKKIFLFLVLIVCSFGNIYAQKEMKQIRSCAKTGKDLNNGLELVAKAEKDSLLRNNPELYYLASKLWARVNDEGNEKIYLKQSYDTLRFFQSVSKIAEYTLKTDSMEQIPDDKGRVHFHHRKEGFSQLSNCMSNLFSAGNYCLKKNKIKEASTYYSLYIRVANSPILKSSDYKLDMSKVVKSAYFNMVCQFKLENYDSLINYVDLALKDEHQKEQVYDLVVRSARKLNDEKLMLDYLTKGLMEYPDNAFFFSGLTDYYNGKGEHYKAIELADHVMEKGNKSTLVKYAKSATLLLLKKYDECIALSKEIVDYDSTYADSYYNIGISYCNKAAELEADLKPNVLGKRYRGAKEEIRKMYSEAREPMETFRKLKPADQDRWGAPLYRIYLALNMGKEFDEVGKLVKK